jgi:hypothetical protein
MGAGKANGLFLKSWFGKVDWHRSFHSQHFGRAGRRFEGMLQAVTTEALSEARSRHGRRNSWGMSGVDPFASAVADSMKRKSLVVETCGGKEREIYIFDPILCVCHKESGRKGDKLVCLFFPPIGWKTPRSSLSLSWRVAV